MGKGGANLCPGLLWSILWFIALLLAWWFAFIMGWFYVFFIPFTVCISPCKDICEALLKLVQLPLTCAENMIAMKAMC
ncbi:hypothetical protein EB796_016806 [Bugula neritina]|uniref:Uncharacterized protein n=1 Tax=Bugula neritina TaxID=10212 RepID=A0A7J7JF73_BUGNE|nr:hypothetical protein EB796_016806 [Bugula neritina]